MYIHAGIRLPILWYLPDICRQLVVLPRLVGKLGLELDWLALWGGLANMILDGAWCSYRGQRGKLTTNGSDDCAQQSDHSPRDDSGIEAGSDGTGQNAVVIIIHFVVLSPIYRRERNVQPYPLYKSLSLFLSPSSIHLKKHIFCFSLLCFFVLFCFFIPFIMFALLLYFLPITGDHSKQGPTVHTKPFFLGLGLGLYLTYFYSTYLIPNYYGSP